MLIHHRHRVPLSFRLQRKPVTLASSRMASRKSFLMIMLLNMIMLKIMMVFPSCEAHYLSVSSRWLVREADGSRAKLACVSWASHLEPMIPEGLSKQPLHTIAFSIRSLGFNCVRLTWPTLLFTDSSLSAQTLRQTFSRLKLPDPTLRGIIVHNPHLVDLPLTHVFRLVVSGLAHVGLLIILDNHVSKPQRCCDDKDGNGFFGDASFDVDSWVQGLALVASAFKDVPEVVGMSLRNELRGPRQNTQDWYKYMGIGARAVHDANPKLIVIISGLHRDTDLHFLADSPLTLGFKDKLVYEMHWYASSYGVNFGEGNLNTACGIATSSLMKCGGFVTSLNATSTAPLFVSEFGVDQRGQNKAEDRFVTCLFAFVASMDLDWSYYPLQGGYYVNNGHHEAEEVDGILNAQWSEPRNLGFLARLQAIQQPWQRAIGGGAASHTKAYQVLFHPATGLCLQKGYGNTLLLGPCTAESITHWRFSAQGRIEMANSYFCVGVEGEGQPAKLAVVGTEKNGPWSTVSIIKLQYATKIHHGLLNNNVGVPPQFNESNNGLSTSTTLNKPNEDLPSQQPPLAHDVALCLDGSVPPSVISKRCICIQDDDSDCGPNDDPSSQWFVPINATSSTLAYAPNV